MPEKHIAAAIDGPVGAGKSSIAREAAKKLGFIYVDTGALYRAVGLYCHRCGANMKDPADIASRLPEIKPEIRLCDGVQHIYLNGEDVSSEIRLPEISMAASAVSAVPEVRAALLGIQRGIAAENNVIMDGRDIGTVVLPSAQVKIFLTAAPEARAERRLLELRQRGQEAEFDAVLSDILRRDEQDRTRAVAPLRQAEDAVLLDTTELDRAGSLEALLAIVREGLSR